MIGLNGKELTPLEYRGLFRDILESKCNNTFNTVEDQLLFITIQPDRVIRCQFEMQGLTYNLFKDCRYVEVLEQTYRISRKDRTGKFLEGYHSHILIRQSDYDKISHTLSELDIVDKVVYDLEGLTERYLLKQVGVTSIRDYLPTNHIPLSEIVPIPPPQEESLIEAILERLVSPVVNVIRMVCYLLRGYENANRINEINRNNMFVNDT